MSLVKTLGRVAAGVVLAKGLGAAMQHRQQQTARSGSGQPGDSGQSRQGGLLGELFGNNLGREGGGLGQILGGSRNSGGATSYGGPNSPGAQGGLGGMLDRLTQQTRGGSGSSGGFGDLLGGLLGGAAGGAAAGGAAAGGLAQKGAQPSNDATFGELFNDAVSHDAEPEVAPTPEQNAVAGLMLKAMIQAAKSDGKIDDAEKQRLLGELGDLDEDERQFIREQMAAPVDAEALAREVPEGLEAQVYLMSLMAIDLDHEDEARYLDALARALKIGRTQANQIHDEAGAKRLYNS